jgi:hypothetical protein
MFFRHKEVPVVDQSMSLSVDVIEIAQDDDEMPSQFDSTMEPVVEVIERYRPDPMYT